MTSATIHLRNLLANWIGHGATMVVLFFLSPFIVHTLGTVEYGIWCLLTVLTGYMGILDLGVRASTGRYIILYLGAEDRQAVDQTIRTSLGFFSALGGVVVLAGLGAGWLFPSVFRTVPEDRYLLVQLLLPFLALNVWFSAIQAVFSSVLVAHDRFDLARAVDLAVLVIQTTATVIVLKSGLGIGGLAGATLGGHVLGVAGHWYFAHRLYRELRVWPLRLESARLRELLGYGLAAFVTAISVRVIGQTDVVVAGAAIGVVAAGIYSVGASLVYYSNSFLSLINTTLFPSIQRAVARGEIGSVRWLFLRAGRLGLLCGLLVYVGMLMFAEPFIRLWMHGPKFGDDAVRQAALVMSILAASKLPLLFAGASVPVLNAMGHVRLTAILAAVEAVMNLGLSLLFVLVFGWGLAGIAGGTLAARLLVGTFVVPWYACAKTRMRWSKYLAVIGGAEILAGSLLIALCAAVRAWLPGGNWGRFFAQIALVSAVYAALAMWLLVPSADRRRFWRGRRPASALAPLEETTFVE